MNGRRVSKEQIDHKCDELNLTIVDVILGEHDTVVRYICNKHPTVGVQSITWGHLKNARFGCRICAGKCKTTEEFILGNPKINPNVHILSEYTKYDEPLDCQCNDCGFLWSTTPASLRQGCGCPECGKIKRGLACRKSPEEFAAKVYAQNPNIEIITPYTRLHDPITCRCKIDGTIFVVTQAANLLHENVQCPYCTTSKSEQIIINILNKHGFDYEFHYRFDDCRYILTLEFDFVLFDDDGDILCAIEYDGEQHFMPIDFAGKGEIWALQHLHITQERDKAKTNYCYEKHIPLIRIPYWERKNMECFILSKINLLNKIAV